MNLTITKDGKTYDIRSSIGVNIVQDLCLIQNQPRLVIITASSFVELMVNYLIDANCRKHAKKIHESNRDYPLSVKLVILSELGVISDEMFDAFNWLRKIRNEAAHDAFYQLKQETLDACPLTPKPTLEKFYDFFARMLSDFAGRHPQLQALQLSHKDDVKRIASSQETSALDTGLVPADGCRNPAVRGQRFEKRFQKLPQQLPVQYTV